MPQISYLVRSQAVARLSNATTGFNAWLATACAAQSPQPTPFVIDWTPGSTNFWQSYVTTEQLDASSPDEGTVCMVYGLRIATPGDTYQKFSIFGGPVEIGVAFDIGWTQSFAPNDTDGLADAVDDALVQTFNASTYWSSFSGGVLWNGRIEGTRGPLRETGPGWRQRIEYRLAFELQA